MPLYTTFKGLKR